MASETATARTSRGLRAAGVIAVIGGVLLALLPGFPGGCWANTRLFPAIPLVVFGAVLVGLAGRKFRFDRQDDEIAGLRQQIAARHGVPGFAVDGGVGQLKGGWARLPFLGLLLIVLAVSAAVASTGSCSGATSTQWGAATGFAAGGVIVTTIGVRRYRRAVTENAALIDRLRAYLDEAPGETGTPEQT